MKPHTLAAALLLATPPVTLGAQTPAAAPINFWADDSARVAFVTTHGRSSTRGRTTVWAPTDSVDPVWFAAFVDSLAAAQASLDSLLGGPYPWQRIGRAPVVFYLSPGRFVSHASGAGAVFISVSRARSGTAPYLHEAAHELLAPLPPFWSDEYPDSAAGQRAAAVFPQWLNEGFADYVAQAAAAATGFHEGDVFQIGGLGRVDSTCAARLRESPRRSEIAERIGGTGRLEALFTTERQTVAPVFYACSQSFTKYVVERVGLRRVVQLFPAIPSGAWRTELEQAAGKSLAELRGEWLRVLGARD